MEIQMEKKWMRKSLPNSKWNENNGSPIIDYSKREKALTRDLTHIMYIINDVRLNGSDESICSLIKRLSAMFCPIWFTNVRAFIWIWMKARYSVPILLRVCSNQMCGTHIQPIISIWPTKYALYMWSIFLMCSVRTDPFL